MCQIFHKIYKRQNVGREIRDVVLDSIQILCTFLKQNICNNVRSGKELLLIIIIIVINNIIIIIIINLFLNEALHSYLIKKMKCKTGLTVVENSDSAVSTTAIIRCGTSGGSVQWRRWRRTGGGSARCRTGRTPAGGRIPRRRQHTRCSRWFADHVYLFLILFILCLRLWGLLVTAAVRPWVGLPLLGHEAPRHLADVSGVLFITPVASVSSSSTSAPLCCRRLQRRLSNGFGRTRALINVVTEALKNLLMSSSGEWRAVVDGVFKPASCHSGCWCRGTSSRAKKWFRVVRIGQTGPTCTRTGSVVGCRKKTRHRKYPPERTQQN
jgi:hypothetical protein